MKFLKSLFGGGASSSAVSDRDGVYFYVRPDGCDEVIKLRVNRMNDLSESDDDNTFFVHKVARGVKCRKSVDVDLYFNGQRQLSDQNCTGGVFVDAAAWQAWIDSQQPAEPVA